MAQSVVSDTLQGATDEQAYGRYRHEPGYYKNDINNLGKEAFANFGASAATNNDLSIEQIKKYFPTGYNIWEQMRVIGQNVLVFLDVFPGRYIKKCSLN